VPNPELVSDDAAKAIGELLNQMNAIGKKGVASGGEAAKTLVNFKRILNDATDKFFHRNDKALERTVSIAKEGWNNAVGEQFEKAGLSPLYKKLAEGYQRYGDAITAARKVVATEGEEGFAKLLTKPENQMRIKAMIKERAANPSTDLYGKAGAFTELVELLGDKGLKMYEEMITSDTAAKFLKFAPQFHLFTPQKIVSPQAVAKTVTAAQKVKTDLKPALEYGYKSLETLRQMAEEKQLDRFLRDDQAIQAFFRTLGAGMQREQEQTQGLLEKGGI
jgi:hypothetical protein